jgi:anaerobic selenocysteine-containing dehydrogenase
MVAYADLILPDTTYLERHDCISLLDRPISRADDAPRRDPLAGGRTGPRRARLPVGPDRSRRAAGLPGFVDDDGSPRYKPITPTTWSPRAQAGHRPAGRLARRDGDARPAAATPIPTRSTLHREWRLLRWAHPARGAILQAVEQGLSGLGRRDGLFDKPQPYSSSSTPNRCASSSWPPRARGPAAARNARPGLQAFDPLPDLVCALSKRLVDKEEYPYHALTQRPAAMYHSWGSRMPGCADPRRRTRSMCRAPSAMRRRAGRRRLGVGGPRRTGASGAGARTAAVNAKTMWTWNAIGKRKGAWALDRDAPEVARLSAQPPDP